MNLKNFEDYIAYLRDEKDLAQNSIQAYERDIRNFNEFVLLRGVQSLDDAANSDVSAFMMMLKNEGMSKSTLQRKLASIRGYYNFIMEKGVIHTNPALKVKSPRIEKNEIDFVSMEEIDKLLDLPDDSPKGIRDRAIMELMYATGIRATELIEMKLEDVNLKMGFVKCIGEHSKARIIPMGRICRTALERYISDVRKSMAEEENPYLIVNAGGKQLTRQGLWKIIREYGEKADMGRIITPQTIRNSFAVHMLKNGADIKTLQELMGHEDITATQAYLSVIKNRLKDVYDHTHPRA